MGHAPGALEEALRRGEVYDGAGSSTAGGTRKHQGNKEYATLNCVSRCASFVHMHLRRLTHVCGLVVWAAHHVRAGVHEETADAEDEAPNIWNSFLELVAHCRSGVLSELFLEDVELAKISLCCHFSLDLLCEGAQGDGCSLEKPVLWLEEPALESCTVQEVVTTNSLWAGIVEACLWLGQAICCSV